MAPPPNIPRSPLAHTSPMRVTVGLALVLILNGFVLNSLLPRVSPPGFRETVLEHSRDVVHARSSFTDSWRVMTIALEQLGGTQPRPLYTEVFFERHIKFQYPPFSLLPWEGLQRINPEWVKGGGYPYRGPSPSLDEMVSLAFVLVLALAAVLIVDRRLSALGIVSSVWQRCVLGALVVGLALTFYPVVKGFTLGQIQTWLNSLFAVALLAWVFERRAVSGVLIGLLCLVKPHYGLFLLWGLMRREWRFVASFSATAAVGLAVAVLRYGWTNHVDYLAVLTYMSRHGEGFYPNQSVNGLLNRLMNLSQPGVFGNLDFFESGFPPFHPVVYGITVATSLALLVAALRPGTKRQDSTLDLCVMAVSCTMASPIAWEHHYGVLFPVYAVLLTSPAMSKQRLMWLATSYVLVSNFLPITNVLANTPLNVIQSYLFAGALVLLALLHAARRVVANDGTQNAHELYRLQRAS